MKKETRLSILSILSIILLIFGWGCEKSTVFDRDSAIKVRIKSSELVTVQIDGNIRTELLGSTDSVNRYLGFMLLEGSRISFSGMQVDGEVIVNLDTLVLVSGATITYVVSESTRVPEDRFCEVWPELRECFTEPAPDEDEPDGDGEGNGDGE